MQTKINFNFVFFSGLAVKGVENESKEVTCVCYSCFPTYWSWSEQNQGCVCLWHLSRKKKKKCIGLVILSMLIDSKFPRELKIKFNFIMQNLDCKLNVFFQRYLVCLPKYKAHFKADGFVSAGILLITHRFQLDYSVKFCNIFS